ncbi:MAG: 50S ribosomal protein L31 [Coriobacteriia bacterium]|nr:50S ribosomal protein L31 [Coriobacteriia bacterium]
MRSDIHPDYKVTEYTCSCGNTFESRSTKGGAIRVELCNKCHPFFTGTQKFVDTGGRVQRFADKFGAAAAATLEKEKAATEARRAEAEARDAEKAAAREERAAAKAARAAEFDKAAPAEPATGEAAHFSEPSEEEKAEAAVEAAEGHEAALENADVEAAVAEEHSA